MLEIPPYVYQDTKQTIKILSKDVYKDRNLKHAKNLLNLSKKICEGVPVLINF